RRIVAVAALAVLLAASAYAETPDLFALITTGTPQSIQAAIDKGADVNTKTRLYSPLMWAIQINRDPEVISTLLNAGANAKASDSRGRTPLMYVIDQQKPNPEVISMLFKAGADVNASDKGGKTPLMYVVEQQEPNLEV